MHSQVRERYACSLQYWRWLTVGLPFEHHAVQLVYIIISLHAGPLLRYVHADWPDQSEREGNKSVQHMLNKRIASLNKLVLNTRNHAADAFRKALNQLWVVGCCHQLLDSCREA